MALATVDDVKRIFRDRDVRGGQRIGIGSDATDHITDADVKKYMAPQETYVLARLKFNPGGNKLINEVHANLTAYHIWIHIILATKGGEIPDYVQEWQNWAEGILTMIDTGQIQITKESPEGELTTKATGIHEQRWEDITLVGTTFQYFSYDKIVPGSVQVFDAKDGDTEYIQGLDFEIINRSGEIRRLPDSRITDGQTVYCDYLYLRPGFFDISNPAAAHDSKSIIDYGRMGRHRRFP